MGWTHRFSSVPTAERLLSRLEAAINVLFAVAVFQLNQLECGTDEAVSLIGRRLNLMQSLCMCDFILIDSLLRWVTSQFSKKRKFNLWPPRAWVVDHAEILPALFGWIWDSPGRRSANEPESFELSGHLYCSCWFWTREAQAIHPEIDGKAGIRSFKYRQMWF